MKKTEKMIEENYKEADTTILIELLVVQKDELKECVIQTEKYYQEVFDTCFDEIDEYFRC